MKPTYTVKHRRKREGKTDYKLRRQLLTARKPRIVIRKSNTKVTVQLVEYVAAGDKVVFEVTSKELQSMGWKLGLKNTTAAYLTGLLAGKKMLEAKVKAGVVDLGRQSITKGNKLLAVIKGLSDAGVNVGGTNKLKIGEDRVEGAHLVALQEALSKEQFKNQNTKVKSDLAKAKDLFAQVKKKITQ